MMRFAEYRDALRTTAQLRASMTLDNSANNRLYSFALFEYALRQSAQPPAVVFE
jgi:hypothetical protein